MAYLDQNPPKQRQFRRPRRASVSGVIVVHTAESVMDTVGPDTGAENVAKFIQGRSDYGSYHILADSDSYVHLVEFDAEAYGDGTGSNTHAIHISFACATTDWAKMGQQRRAAFLRQGAKGTADAIRWVKKNRGIDVPVSRISRAESEARRPGFISHGERDPGRRTDPGKDFPWQEFFRLVRAELKGKPRPVRRAITQAIQKEKQARQAVRAAEQKARESGYPAVAAALDDAAQKVQNRIKQLRRIRSRQTLKD